MPLVPIQLTGWKSVHVGKWSPPMCGGVGKLKNHAIVLTNRTVLYAFLVNKALMGYTGYKNKKYMGAFIQKQHHTCPQVVCGTAAPPFTTIEQSCSTRQSLWNFSNPVQPL